MEQIKYLVFVILIHSTCGNLFGIKPRVNTLTQADEVLNLLKRNIPKHYTLFDIKLKQRNGTQKEVVNIQTYQKDGKVKKFFNNLGIFFCFPVFLDPVTPKMK
jgi:hypothetical protein